ncbi:MAG: short-chain dehydrogenase/reductase, partial [Proteobacteria bacterium]|nr:short-chain dehydrogenase/reductase [Pseudomonadota bacterium]
LRLVIGKYALDKARRTIAGRDAELKTWEAASVAADGPAS